jgi:hypothetical protein
MMLTAMRYHLSCPRVAAGNLFSRASKREIASCGVGSGSRAASILMDAIPCGCLAKCYN